MLTAALTVHRMKLLQAAAAAGVLTSVCAVDVDVAVGPFGPIQGAENRLLASLSWRRCLRACGTSGGR